jgi:hypothetical protein
LKRKRCNFEIKTNSVYTVHAMIISRGINSQPIYGAVSAYYSETSGWITWKWRGR